MFINFVTVIFFLFYMDTITKFQPNRPTVKTRSLGGLRLVSDVPVS